MTYPLVSELAEAGIPVTVTCRVLKLARQPYYRWRNDPVRDADVLRAYRINALHDAHVDDPTFGYRYLADEARRAGWRMSRRTAWKLCSQAGIRATPPTRERERPARPCSTIMCSACSAPTRPTESGSPTSSATRRS